VINMTILSGAYSNLVTSLDATKASSDILSDLDQILYNDFLAFKLSLDARAACVSSIAQTICELLTQIEESEEHSDGIDDVLDTDRATPPDTAHKPGESVPEYRDKLAKISVDIASTEDAKLKKLRDQIITLKMQLVSMEKRKSYLEANMPEDYEKNAWCADLTNNLTGEVATIEVPGELGNLQIVPNYIPHTYDQEADGILLPSITMSAAQAFLNIACLPAWQKWKPTFRYGTITAIDEDIADVTLEDVKSSQQSLGINRTATLTDVTIEYMNCNGGAFEVGDEVLIKFTNQTWETPMIVGFKDNPQPCGGLFALFHVIDPGSYLKGFILDLMTGEPAKLVSPGTGLPLDQPYNMPEYSSNEIIAANNLVSASITAKSATTGVDNSQHGLIGTHADPTSIWETVGDTTTRTTTETWNGYADYQERWYSYDNFPDFIHDTSYFWGPMKTGQEQQIDVWVSGNKTFWSDIRDFTLDVVNEHFEQIRFNPSGPETTAFLATINALEKSIYQHESKETLFVNHSGSEIDPYINTSEIISGERIWTVFSLDGTEETLTVPIEELVNSYDENSIRAQYYIVDDYGVCVYFEDTEIIIEDLDTSEIISLKKQSLTYTTVIDEETYEVQQISEADMYSLFEGTKTDTSNIAFLGIYESR